MNRSQLNLKKKNQQTRLLFKWKKIIMETR